MLVCSNARRFFVDFARRVEEVVKVRRQRRDGWGGAWRGIVVFGETVASVESLIRDFEEVGTWSSYLEW
jgi:hypothetical protein